MFLKVINGTLRVISMMIQLTVCVFFTSLFTSHFQVATVAVIWQLSLTVTVSQSRSEALLKSQTRAAATANAAAVGDQVLLVLEYGTGLSNHAGVLL